jgi:hypothetical protein
MAFRRRLREDLARLERGEDPSVVFRDPAANEGVFWPDNRREHMTEAITTEEWWRRKKESFSSALRSGDDFFPLYAGQPEHVREQYLEAMGA